MTVDLVDVLDRTADVCIAIGVPADTATQDAVVIAAMRLGYEVLGLAQRILVAQREMDAQLNDRRPYPPPKPPPPPPPPDKDGE